MSTFHLVRKRKFKEMHRKQSKYDDFLVFDEQLQQTLVTNENENGVSGGGNGNTEVQQQLFVIQTPLAYVDFVPTYKFDAITQRVNLIEYG